jgi:rhodanese-related sulfurtransferase/predicted transcriptional regulator
MGDRVAKDALFDGFAGMAKALANGRRAELIDVLAQGERHVEELADEIDQSVANTSFHLRTLAGAGLVVTRRDGNRIYYRLASDRVIDLWTALRDVAAAHHAELDELAQAYLGRRDELDEVSRAELVARIATGDVVVLDVRPPAEYASGHIAGARSIPAARLARELRNLPDGVEVIAYCRGPYCVLADEAVRLLRRRGRAARRLQDGFPEWRHANLPVEVIDEELEGISAPSGVRRARRSR